MELDFDSIDVDEFLSSKFNADGSLKNGKVDSSSANNTTATDTTYSDGTDLDSAPKIPNEVADADTLDEFFSQEEVDKFLENRYNSGVVKAENNPDLLTEIGIELESLYKPHINPDVVTAGIDDANKIAEQREEGDIDYDVYNVSENQPAQSKKTRKSRGVITGEIDHGYDRDGHGTVVKTDELHKSKPILYENPPLGSILSNSKFTEKSMKSVYDSKLEENLNKGMKKGEAKSEVYKYLEEKGATPHDMLVLDQVNRGITPSTKVFGKGIGRAPDLAIQGLEKHVVEPATEGAALVGLGMSYLSHDAITAATAVASLAIDTTSMDNFNQEWKDKLDQASVTLDALGKKYEEEYGTSNFSRFAVKYSPDLLMMSYNPSNWVKLAMIPTAVVYGQERAEGSSKIQAGAMAMITFASIGALDKVIKVGSNIFAGRAGGKFKNINSVPPKYREQIRELQRENGWSDEQAMSIINEYSKSIDNGILYTQDAVRILAQSNSTKTSKILFEDVIGSNKLVADKLISEISKRAENVLAMADKKTKLGKLILNSNKSYRGKSAIDWVALERKIDKLNINKNDSLIKVIKHNAKVYYDYDMALYRKFLIDKGVTSGGNVMDDFVGGVKSVATYMAAKQIGHAVGQTILMPFSPVVRIVNAITSRAPTIRNKIIKSIKESIKRGHTQAEFSIYLKKLNPTLTDYEVKIISKAMYTAASGSKEPVGVHKAPEASGEFNVKKTVTSESPAVDHLNNGIKRKGQSISAMEKVDTDNESARLIKEYMEEQQRIREYKTPIEVVDSFNKSLAGVRAELSKATPGSKEYSELMSKTREAASNKALGEGAYDDFIHWRETNPKKHFSSYLYYNDDLYTKQNVIDYYTLNPSRLKDGKFGMPKVIAEKYGIDQVFVKNPIIKGKPPKKFSDQDIEEQAVNRMKYGKDCK